MKLLIIRFSSIGDIVLTTPVIRCIKKQVPDVQIHFLTKYAYRQIVASNPFVDKVHLLQGDNWDVLLETLKAEGFDQVIDLHKNLRTLKVKRALKKAKAFSFDKLNWEKWLLTTLKINRMPSVHIVDRYLATVKHLGVTNDGRGLDYFIPKDEHIKETDLPMSHMAGYIGLVIGASYATKKLPVEKLQQLCTLIGHPIVLLGGPEDRTIGDRVSSIDPFKIYNSCGKYTLNESADLVKRSKFIISHDTGLMHIAAAFKKPVISIWGNTVPTFGMTPYYGTAETKNKIFEVNGLSCRPCSKLGHQKCPKGHFKCMQQQDLEGMVKLVNEWLGK